MNLSLFQFHKGSINTRAQYLNSNYPAIFQFHKGSINTVVKKTSDDAEDNFNSIKVRLILYHPYVHQRTSVQFQFHKGSINTNTDYKHQIESHLFQFHKGSINTGILRFVTNNTT